MRLIKKIKRFFFGIHEIIWVVVHEIENWLYPYCDRPVDDIFQDDEDCLLYTSDAADDA